MDLVESAVRRWVEQVDAEKTGLQGISKPLTAEKLRFRQRGRRRTTNFGWTTTY